MTACNNARYTDAKIREILDQEMDTVIDQIVKIAKDEQQLMTTHRLDPTSIDTRDAIDTGADAFTLLKTHDLVVNATADFSITAL